MAQEIINLTVPTQGYAHLRNGFINWLTALNLHAYPSNSIGQVVELSVNHRRGQATGHITVQASAFTQLCRQYLEALGYQITAPEETMRDGLAELSAAIADTLGL